MVALLVRALHLTKLLEQFRAAGQPHQRTVDPQQAVPAPKLECWRVLRSVEIIYHGLLVQFDKGAGQQLGPRMSHSSCRCTGAGVPRSGPLSQKFMEPYLERLKTLLQNQQHNDREGQLALASEIFGSLSVRCKKARVGQKFASRLKNGDRTFSTDRFMFHPDLNYRLYLHCTFKNLTKCFRVSYFNGSGAGVRGHEAGEERRTLKMRAPALEYSRLHYFVLNLT